MPVRQQSESRSAAGFTLLELMIVVTILAVLSTVGVTQYRSALGSARKGKSIGELRMLAGEIDVFRAQWNRLPLSLAEVGRDGIRDPWGQPYCYLNFLTGSGDGLAWAVDLGLVDPASLSGASSAAGSGAGGNGNRNGNGNGPGPGGGGGGPGNGNPGTALTNARARMDEDSPAAAVLDRLLAGLGPSASSGVVLGPEPPVVENLEVVASVEDTKRRDSYLFPLNSDYDLFSLGPDAATAAALGAAASRDDLIRANDGGYFGTAADY